MCALASVDSEGGGGLMPALRPEPVIGSTEGVHVPALMRCAPHGDALMIETDIPIGGGETLVVYLTILQRTIAVSDGGWTCEQARLYNTSPEEMTMRIVGGMFRHANLLFNPETGEAAYLASSFAEAIKMLPNLAVAIITVRRWIGVAT